MNAQVQDLWHLYPMSPGLLPQVMVIEREAYQFPWSEGNFRDCIASGYSAWVVESAFQEVMAYGVMTMGAGEAHILNLCVAVEYQGQGIGRFMLEHLVSVAQAADIEMLLLEVRVSNKAAQGLYLGRGFNRLGVRKGYYPAADGREDALVLGLNLK